ncbi:MAG: hypothetical protein IPK66_19150 [Rhodospirillales bacterium]|nr:hypothetical protein [Rhodospirillales bacterium]
MFSWDETGVAINPPRAVSEFEIYGGPDSKDHAPQFTLTVGENGLAGIGTLF